MHAAAVQLHGKDPEAAALLEARLASSMKYSSNMVVAGQTSYLTKAEDTVTFSDGKQN